MTTYKLSIRFGKTSIQLKSTDAHEIDETVAALTDKTSKMNWLPVTLRGNSQQRTVHIDRRDITEIVREEYPEPVLFEHGIFS